MDDQPNIRESLTKPPMETLIQQGKILYADTDSIMYNESSDNFNALLEHFQGKEVSTKTYKPSSTFGLGKKNYMQVTVDLSPKYKLAMIENPDAEIIYTPMEPTTDHKNYWKTQIPPLTMEELIVMFPDREIWVRQFFEADKNTKISMIDEMKQTTDNSEAISILEQLKKLWE